MINFNSRITCVNHKHITVLPIKQLSLKITVLEVFIWKILQPLFQEVIISFIRILWSKISDFRLSALLKMFSSLRLDQFLQHWVAIRSSKNVEDRLCERLFMSAWAYAVVCHNGLFRDVWGPSEAMKIFQFSRNFGGEYWYSVGHIFSVEYHFWPLTSFCFRSQSFRLAKLVFTRSCFGEQEI
jgi:hypothetical protein